MHANLLGVAKTWIWQRKPTSFLLSQTIPTFLIQNVIHSFYISCCRLQVAIMLNQPFSSSTLIGARIRVCCFCRSALTRSQRYSNVSWVTRKCSSQRKCSAVWAIRRQNQFCSRGQTQALLLSCGLCCCESPAIHISNIRRFLWLILKASYIKAKQYICWSAKDRCRKSREAKIKIRHAIWTFRGRMVKVNVWVSCYLLCRVVSTRK